MDNSKLEMSYAKRVPKEIRDLILEKKFIETADEYSDALDTPMEFLFDVHEEFLDPSKNIGPFSCPKCRLEVLTIFSRLLPYFLQLKDIENV